MVVEGRREMLRDAGGVRGGFGKRSRDIEKEEIEERGWGMCTYGPQGHRGN